ncbi:MAG TPA: response regulator [Lunatimonas sp.]|nr:response regulator [Lunatimonas sp.]
MERIKQLTLVDDDDVFVYLTTNTIKKTNRVDLIKVFGNGLDAMNFLKENRGDVDALPDILFLDLSMPIMDGWQFLNEFVKINPFIGKKIHIYICSSSISPEDMAMAKTIKEVSDFIIKPIHKEKLLDIINHV